MKKKNIVAIDDEPDVLEIIKLFLSKRNKNYVIKDFINSEHAFEYISENSGDINLIISDIMMPVLNGIDLIKNSKNLNNIPVIYLTAASFDDIIEEAYKLNDCTLKIGYINKPVNNTILISEVETMLNLQEKTLSLIYKNREIINLMNDEMGRNKKLVKRLDRILKDYEEKNDVIKTIKEVISNLFSNDLPLIKLIAEIIEGSKDVIGPIIKMTDEEYFRIIPYTDRPLRKVVEDLENLSTVLIELGIISKSDLTSINLEDTAFYHMLDNLYKNGRLDFDTFNKLLEKIKTLQEDGDDKDDDSIINFF